MSCLGRAAVPVKRVWRGLRARLRLRRATGMSSSSSSMSSSYYAPVDDDDDVGAVAVGLGRLRKEVSTCEYSDVHVMWEMLSTTTNGGGGARAAAGRRGGGAAGKGSGRRGRVGRKAAVAWSRLASYCCAL